MIPAPMHGSRTFLPGERVPETGIYECRHSDRHTAAKQLMFESGHKFPLCNVCFWSVRYLLVGNCTAEDMDAARRKKNDVSVRTMSA